MILFKKIRCSSLRSNLTGAVKVLAAGLYLVGASQMVACVFLFSVQIATQFMVPINPMELPEIPNHKDDFITQRLMLEVLDEAGVTNEVIQSWPWRVRFDLTDFNELRPYLLEAIGGNVALAEILLEQKVREQVLLRTNELEQEIEEELPEELNISVDLDLRAINRLDIDLTHPDLNEHFNEMIRSIPIKIRFSKTFSDIVNDLGAEVEQQRLDHVVSATLSGFGLRGSTDSERDLNEAHDDAISAVNAIPAPAEGENPDPLRVLSEEHRDQLKRELDRSMGRVAGFAECSENNQTRFGWIQRMTIHSRENGLDRPLLQYDRPEIERDTVTGEPVNEICGVYTNSVLSEDGEAFDLQPYLNDETPVTLVVELYGTLPPDRKLRLAGHIRIDVRLDELNGDNYEEVTDPVDNEDYVRDTDDVNTADGTVAEPAPAEDEEDTATD